MSAITMNIDMLDKECCDVRVVVPAKYEICHCCQGAGKSSAYLGAFSRDEMDEQGQEFMEDYMSGQYDRPCEKCEGSGKLLVIDEANCITDQQKWALEWVRDQQQMLAEERAIAAAERRAGA